MFKMKKSSATRAFACLLILFMLLAGWAIAETVSGAEAPAQTEAAEQAVEPAAEADAAAASLYMTNEYADPEEVKRRSKRPASRATTPRSASARASKTSP